MTTDLDRVGAENAACVGRRRQRGRAIRKQADEGRSYYVLRYGSRCNVRVRAIGSKRV